MSATLPTLSPAVLEGSSVLLSDVKADTFDEASDRVFCGEASEIECLALARTALGDFMGAHECHETRIAMLGILDQAQASCPNGETRSMIQHMLALAEALHVDEED